MNKEEITWRIRVYGIVQGVGFRPTVSRHATTHGIRGTVCNKGPYVEIYAQGTKALRSLAPPLRAAPAPLGCAPAGRPYGPPIFALFGTA